MFLLIFFFFFNPKNHLCCNLGRGAFDCLLCVFIPGVPLIMHIRGTSGVFFSRYAAVADASGNNTEICVFSHDLALNGSACPRRLTLFLRTLCPNRSPEEESIDASSN